MGRITDRLNSRYKEIKITTPADDNAVSAIKNAHIFFIIIDKHWVERIQGATPSDGVGSQLQLALSLGRLPVVPLLVGDAELPSEAQLGKGLEPLAYRNAIRVDPGSSFDQDLNLLVEGINRHFLGVPITFTTAALYSGPMAQLIRLADRLLPVNAPPEEFRGAPGFVIALYAFSTLFFGGALTLAISERNLWMALLSGFMVLLIGRVAVFALREAFATPYFQGKPEIFLSYRRADTLGMAGRVYDRLGQWFNPQKIFIDVGGCIPIGVNFRDYLDYQISSSRLVMLLIGSDWTGDQGFGVLRIFGDRDFVRIEVESALKRAKAVIVVLLDRESPPKDTELPDSIRAIRDLPPIIVRNGPSFDDDMKRLRIHLRETLKVVRPSIFGRWTQTAEDYIGSPWWQRVLIYSTGVLIGISFIVLIYTGDWVSNSWGEHLGAGMFATFFAALAFLALGQVVGAFLEFFAGSKDSQREQ